MIVLSDTYTVLYINPSFEVAYSFSNKLVSQSRPKFSELISFESEKVENLKDGLYYNLQFETSRGVSGGTQIALIKRGEVYIVYMRDLEFEERLQAKYKALISGLRDSNKKLNQSLNDGYERLNEQSEILKVLDFESTFCVFKTTEDFRILDFSYKGIESELSVKLKGLNLLNLITMGRAEDLIFFHKVLKSSIFVIENSPYPLLSVEFSFSGKTWKGSFYGLRDPNLILHFYFVLKEMSSKTLENTVGSKITKISKVDKRKDWALELLRSNIELILCDFGESQEINSRKIFRNYFWQKLILKRKPAFLENFLKTHLLKASWGAHYKVLTLKNLSISLKQSLDMNEKNAIQEFNQLSFNKQTSIYKELVDLDSEMRIKASGDLRDEDLYSALGCLNYFVDFTKLEINNVSIKQADKYIEIKFFYASPRKAHLAYDFLKKSGVKGYEMGKDFLEIYI